MPLKRSASQPATNIEQALPPDGQSGRDHSPASAVEKQPKLEGLDLITEFSKPPRHAGKREASPVKSETLGDVSTDHEKTFVKGSRTYLSVLIAEKEIAKTHGAQWDAAAKRW